MALAKAQIFTMNADGSLSSPLDVQYNPSELSFDKKTQIAEIAIPGLDAPIQQFVRGQAERLSLELFFDATSNGMGEGSDDVRTQTDPFYQLAKVQSEIHAAPRILFTWGEGLSLKAIVEGVTRKFTLFNPRGVPIRATLTIALREYRTLEDQLAELNLQSPDHTKTRPVKRGDTLAGIAAEEYDDPRLWRAIADANPSVAADPLRLTPGLVLTIPALDAQGKPVGG